jgi:cell division protein FtsZ
MPFELQNEMDNIVDIKVIGVGGGGGNAIDRMLKANVQGIDLIAVNTDKQVLLKTSKAPKKLMIGEKLTRGLGAGGVAERGQKAAEESKDEIRALLQGADMVFITAGMGGGTGTGAAPVIASIAQQMGILTVGIVTKPFNFEGKKRITQAQEGIERLKENVDALIVIPNERLKLVTEHKITFANAFTIADDVLRQALQSISDLIQTEAIINLDFADVTTVLKDAGYAHMGMGRATGKDKAEEAAKNAIASPLLETSINGAKSVIINFTSSPDIELAEIELASSMVQKAAHPDANIIFGVAFDESLEDEMCVTVIATGFDENAQSGDTLVSDPAAQNILSGLNKAKPKEGGVDDNYFGDIEKLFK